MADALCPEKRRTRLPGPPRDRRGSPRPSAEARRTPGLRASQDGLCEAPRGKGEHQGLTVAQRLEGLEPRLHFAHRASDAVPLARQGFLDFLRAEAEAFGAVVKPLPR